MESVQTVAYMHTYTYTHACMHTHIHRHTKCLHACIHASMLVLMHACTRKQPAMTACRQFVTTLYRRMNRGNIDKTKLPKLRKCHHRTKTQRPCFYWWFIALHTVCPRCVIFSIYALSKTEATFYLDSSTNYHLHNTLFCQLDSCVYMCNGRTYKFLVKACYT